MLIAGVGMAAALAFVLGLGALALWALRRFGGATLGRRGRLPMEVVQRVSLGPRMQLAVVRVGEKVMAVSLGEGRVDALFELAAEDRERVLAGSTVPVPLPSSEAAQAGIDRMATPSPMDAEAPEPALAPSFGASLAQAMGPRALGAPPAPVLAAAARSAAPAAATFAPRPTPVRRAPGPLPRFRKDEPREIPGFLTAPRGTHGVPSPFPALLLLGLLLVPRAESRAQAAATAATTITAPAPAATQLTAPTPPTVPTPPAAPAVPGARASTAAQVAAPAVPPRRPGNGAQLASQGAASTRPLSQMQRDSAPPPTARIAADEALLQLLPQVDLKVGGSTPDTGLRLNGTVGVVLMMGLLTLLPTLLLMMTGFTRILIVLNFLKQAMGTQTAPPAALVGSLALLLTGFVMGPTLTEVNRTALTPWLDGRMDQVTMMKEGIKPLRGFMLRQTKEADLATFVGLSRIERPASADDVPLHVLMAAFVAGELRTAFQIGFAIYLPFIIIDTVVASVLMSMGMFMLPPAMISLPFKLLLFVLVDGWNLTITSLVQSFK